jgi:pyruvate dehydrogenase E2 component (dihydrolipoamide acetyltransferase)
MSKYEFKLPDIGEGVTEGEVVNWLVKVGDVVKEDQEMVEVMTDKATVTIGAPKAGTIAELRGKVGEVIAVGAVLVVFDLGGGGDAVPATQAAPAKSAAPAPAPAPEAKKDVAASAVGDIRESLPGMGGSSAPKAKRPTELLPAAQDDYFEDKPLAAPATRKLARELEVDIKRVRPTGEGGRVTREDVERTAARGPGSSAQGPGAPSDAAAPTRAAAAPAHAAVSVPALAPLPPGAREERVPIRGMRKRIYENMARSKHTAAHFTYVDECDVSALKALRERSKALAEKRGVRLSFLPYIVKAVVAALKAHPSLNCLVDDASGEMVLRKNYDIGIAAATEAGLTVPVLRNADQRSVLDLAREIDRLGAAARDGKLKMEDLGGSSFTITSLGKQGGLFATPVVNYPEVAILGVHEMKRKPVVRGDEIAIGEVMLLSLSFDHRIIDGHVGAAFAQEIIGFLQEPERLFLEG